MLEHLWIWASARGPGTNAPQILRDDCSMNEMKVDISSSGIAE